MMTSTPPPASSITDPRYVDIIVDNVPNITRIEAEEALRRNQGDIIDAISDLNEEPYVNSLPELDGHDSRSLRGPFRTLLQQLYGLPVELPSSLITNGLSADFIPFEQVSSLPVQGFHLDPLLQPWAGPPSSPNRIVTLILNDGRTVLVKARLEPQTNQIYPPI